MADPPSPILLEPAPDDLQAVLGQAQTCVTVSGGASPPDDLVTRPSVPLVQCQRPGCGNMFAPKREHARFCSSGCRVKHLRRERLAAASAEPSSADASPAAEPARGYEARLKLKPDHPDAIPGDGLRCLRCGAFIHALDGSRTRHIACERQRMRAYHNHATCTRNGALIAT